MTTTSSEERLRREAEAESGMSVSAGARVVHVRTAVASGRAILVDLSTVPEENRPALVAEIKQLVSRAGASSPGMSPTPAQRSPT